MQVHKGLGDSEASCSSNNLADETAEIVNDDMDMNGIFHLKYFLNLWFLCLIVQLAFN